MKSRFASSLLLLCLLALVGSTWAQGSWRDVPQDERRQIRQEMREHWQQGREIRREEGGRRWREVPPEDRRQLRDDMRQQGGWQSGRDQRREGRGERGGRRD